MKQKVILVPEEINIYQVSQPVNRERYGDSLLLGFNGNKQMLGYDTTDDIYVVSQRGNLQPIECRLTPCKRSDLKKGDTIRVLDSQDYNNDRYGKCMFAHSFVYIDGFEIAISEVYISDIVYKVEPIKE